MKAMAITLVVYGHVVAREAPSGAEWYVTSKTVLYLFHMPVFMFVSGLVLGYTYKPVDSLKGYLRYVGRRAGRLAPAYLLLAALIVIGKVAATRVMHVDNAPASVSDALLVVIKPYASPTAFLWYIYVLLMYYVTFPILISIFKKHLYFLPVLGLCLFFIPRTDWFGIGQYTEYFVFFSSGVWVASHLNRVRKLSERGLVVWSVTFFGLLGLATYCALKGWLHDVASEIGMLLLGCSAIPFLFALARMDFRRWRPTLDLLATYTFTIYLFNTLFIGVVKGAATKLVPWDGSNFLWYLPLLWTLGIFLPILFHKFVLARFPRLAAITI